MTEEQTDPFAAFKTAEAPAPSPVKEKKARGRKKKEATGNGKTEHKELMVPLSALDDLAQLDDEGRKAFHSHATNMANHYSKATCRHVAAALAKLFA